MRISRMETRCHMRTFLTTEEIAQMGFAHVGENVLISKNAIFYTPQMVALGSHVRIDDFAVLSGKIHLGSYIHIAQFSGLWGGEEGIYMADYSSLSSRVSLYATSDDFSGESMTNPMIPAEFEPGHIDKPIHIEKYVAIGATSVILPGCTLQEGCAVSAMSLVLKDTLPWTVYAGVPARRVGDRSQKLLELEEQFRRQHRR